MKFEVYCDEALPDLFTSKKPRGQYMMIGALWLPADLREELRYQNFIVVLIMSLAKDGTLKGEFLTCYPVNNNRLPKVRGAPVWNRQDCENALQKR